ncbi:MAG: ABC transporter substrate-binding protein [Deltaproteobacteria bacterium]|nr:ABC transporter substrate-binding protein [Deltaproteobacteria bacterium]
MRGTFFRVAVLFLMLGFWANGSAILAASPDLQKVKQAAEAKGFIFETSHDEIVTKAKKEGRLRVLSSYSPEAFRRMSDLMKKKYPFLDIYIEELTGPEAYQRFLLELKAGAAKDWDAAAATPDMYNDFVPERKKFDILGMAEHGVLAIPPKMIDPNNRGVVAIGSGACSAAYNRKLISPEKVPNTWEDFLKPEFKGEKFIVELRATCLAGLAAGLGEGWVRDYARKIAAQNPVWARGATVAMSRIAAGEYVLHHMHNYHSCVRAAAKDPTGSLACKLIEPVPVRLFDTELIVRTAPHPYAGLLWIETETSPEAQAIMDKYGPLNSSIYAQGKVAEAVKGLKVYGG